MSERSERLVRGPSDIPAGWGEMTPAWMTSALQTAFPGTEVTETELVLQDDGTNRRARFALSYAMEPGPQTVFLKASDPDHAALNAKTGGVLNEARLFSSDVPLYVDCPKVYFTEIDEPNLNFIMVMEDIVGRGCDPRDSLQPMTIAQVESGVRSLAKLHSAYWGGRLSAQNDLWWIEAFTAWRGVMARGIDIGIRRAADTIPPEVQGLTGSVIEDDLWAPYIETLSHDSQTLLHGDPHIGNTYVLPDDGVGFLDWQVVRRGHPSLDVGYFLQGALTIEDRRLSQADLVSAYLDSLSLPPEELPNKDDFWLRYRASTIHGLTMWLVTAASDTWQRPEVSLALAQRYAAAFVDLNASAALFDLK